MTVVYERNRECRTLAPGWYLSDSVRPKRIRPDQTESFSLNAKKTRARPTVQSNPIKPNTPQKTPNTTYTANATDSEYVPSNSEFFSGIFHPKMATIWRQAAAKAELPHYSIQPDPTGSNQIRPMRLYDLFQSKTEFFRACSR